MTAATTGSFAQNKDRGNEPYVGVKAGVNLADFKLGAQVPSGLGHKIDFHPVGGFFANLPISKKFSVEPQLLYSVMGGKFTQSGGDDIRQRLDYLSVPILLKFWLSNKFNINAGPQADILMFAKQKAGSNPRQINTDDTRRDDIAATAGLEFLPGYHWNIAARYIYGTNNFIKPAGYSAYNRGVQVTLGYRFGKKPKPVPPPPPPPPADTDNDGIVDTADKCPTVPGVLKYNGCPVPDTDKDGVNDDEDKCVDVPGIAKYNGCPIPDTDKDGINDEEDKCVDVPGVAKYNGCPIPDRDNDGVNDDDDRCPDVAGPADNGGCPKLETAKFNANAVQFVTGSATLTAAAKKELDKGAKILNETYPQLKVEIAGHTDNTGKPASNQTLSEKRAAAVKAYLVKKGVAADRLTTVGYGQDQPIADNATAKGKAQNRRVEFKVSQ